MRNRKLDHVLPFFLLGLIAPTAAVAAQTTPEERAAFAEKYTGISTAMGVAEFCGNADDLEALKATLVSAAASANLHRGRGMYDAVRELMESVDSHTAGVTQGLRISKVSGDARAAVCTEGTEVAARMNGVAKP